MSAAQVGRGVGETGGVGGRSIRYRYGLLSCLKERVFRVGTAEGQGTAAALADLA